MSFFEFPHTRTYDSDLGWLIKHVGEHETAIESLQDWESEHKTQYSKLAALVESLELGEMYRMVPVNPNGTCPTIAAAITRAREIIANIGGRVTVLIPEGEYQERIELLPNPGIDFIGIGSVTLSSGLAWPNSTIYVSGQTKCINMNFYASQTYAFHADAQNEPTAGPISFIHCTFVSTNAPAVGLGLGLNWNITFNDCTFANQGTGVAFYAHNYPYAGASNQTLIVQNSRFYSNDDLAIGLDDSATLAGVGSGASSPMQIAFPNCYGASKIRFRYGENVTTGYVPAGNNISVLAWSRNTINGVDAEFHVYTDLKIVPVQPNGGYLLFPVPNRKSKWDISSIEITNMSSQDIKSSFTKAATESYFRYDFSGLTIPNNLVQIRYTAVPSTR